MNQQGNNIAAMGGAVGGAPAGVNAMGSMANKHPAGPQDSAQLLNTYIYDYLLRNRHYDLARSFIKSLNVTTSANPKQSPGQRNVNGVDDSMDTDSKEGMDRPDDLPNPGIPMGNASDNSFLYDWWCQFWDVFAAQRGKQTSNQRTVPYMNFSKANAQRRNDVNSQMLNPGFSMMRPGMQPTQADLQKRMMMSKTATPAQMQALQQAQQKNMMSANGMVRDNSGMNMGDQRPQSPANAENAPSPSKRPRLEGNMMNGGMGGPGGRSQPMPGAQMGATSAPGGGQMVMANGMSQDNMGGVNGFAFSAGQGPNAQPKPMEGMNPNGGPPGQMIAQGMEGSNDMFAGNANATRLPGGPNGPGQPPAGNHALQDYQMQLMLLEQQNKKRLLMARQEQDNLTQAPHQGGVSGQPGFGAPAMSPQGSRAGPSPNPVDQMKRGTPKMNQQGLPGSPMPDGSMPGNRASPIPNGTSFDQLPAGIPPQYYQGGPGMGGPNSMRPPSSHPNPNFSGPMSQQQQMEAMRQRGQMPPNGMWAQNQPPQMMNPGQQHPNMGTPQQRSAMPPPPAPQAGGEQQRTQPPSPQQNANANPPTPSQSNKPAPKGKKEKADNKKKIPKKNSTAATGATPASDADPPPTPTPSTPITPMHPNSFKNGQQQGNNQNQQQNAQPTQVAAPQQMDANNQPPFGALDNDPNNLDLNFGSLDGPDVLETFDFDSFLHTEDASGFGAFENFGFPADGVEAGEGMG